jgi:hypothetical protein
MMEILLNRHGDVENVEYENIYQCDNGGKFIKVHFVDDDLPYSLADIYLECNITRPDGEQSGWQNMLRLTADLEWQYEMQLWDNTVYGDATVVIRWKDTTHTDNEGMHPQGESQEVGYNIKKGVIADIAGQGDENYNNMQNTLTALQNKNAEQDTTDEAIFGYKARQGTVNADPPINLSTLYDNKADKVDNFVTPVDTVNKGITNTEFDPVAENVDDNNEELADHERRINTNEGDIADLQANQRTGTHYVGSFTGIAEPTTEQLNAFVQSKEGRPPQNSPIADEVIFTQVDTDGHPLQTIIYDYGANGWDGNPIPPIANAQNGKSGVISGTYGIGSINNVIVDIVGGQIKRLFVKRTDSTYQEINAIVENHTTRLVAAEGQIDGIKAGTIAVGNALLLGGKAEAALNVAHAAESAHTLNADHAASAGQAAHADNADQSTHADDADHAGNADFAAEAGKATNDGISRIIHETYALLTETYTKAEADLIFASKVISELWYISSGGLIEETPTSPPDGVQTTYLITDAAPNDTKAFEKEVNGVISYDNKNKYGVMVFLQSDTTTNADLTFEIYGKHIDDSDYTLLGTFTKNSVVLNANEIETVEVDGLLNAIANNQTFILSTGDTLRIEISMSVNSEIILNDISVNLIGSTQYGSHIYINRPTSNIVIRQEGRKEIQITTTMWGEPDAQTGLYTLEVPFALHETNGGLGISAWFTEYGTGRETDIDIEKDTAGNITMTSSFPYAGLLCIVGGISGTLSPDYNAVENKPQIAGITVVGNKPLSAFGLLSETQVKNLIAEFSQGVAKIKGYFKAELPTITDFLKPGDLIFVWAGVGSPSVSFPYTDVQQWNGTEFVDYEPESGNTGEYTPRPFDTWINLNTAAGQHNVFFWSVTEWEVIDFNVDMTVYRTSTAQDEIDAEKVDKEDGKGLSANDYTTDEKNKLDGIAAGAQVNVIETVKVNGTAITPTDKEVDIAVPTKTSDITNDSDFATNEAVGARIAKEIIPVSGDGVRQVVTAVDFAIDGDTVTAKEFSVNVVTGETKEEDRIIPLADGDETTGHAGLMSKEDKVALGANTVAIGEEATAREDDISAVRGELATEESERKWDDDLIKDDITAINKKIPTQASEDNQLADKNFVNSSISNMSANYIVKSNGSPFETKEALNARTTAYNEREDKDDPTSNIWFKHGDEFLDPTDHDYCIVISDESQTANGAGDYPQTRYICTRDEENDIVTWNLQYIVNNTPFTSAQNDAINSGMTATLAAQIGLNQTAIAEVDNNALKKQPAIILTDPTQADIEALGKYLTGDLVIKWTKPITSLIKISGFIGKGNINLSGNAGTGFIVEVIDCAVGRINIDGFSGRLSFYQSTSPYGHETLSNVYFANACNISSCQLGSGYAYIRANMTGNISVSPYNSTLMIDNSAANITITGDFTCKVVISSGYTGTLTKSNNSAVFIDNRAGNPLTTFLPITGGILAGALTLPGNPTADFQVATKNYVDSTVGIDAVSGINIRYVNASNGNDSNDGKTAATAWATLSFALNQTKDRILKNTARYRILLADGTYDLGAWTNTAEPFNNNIELQGTTRTGTIVKVGGNGFSIRSIYTLISKITFTDGSAAGAISNGKWLLDPGDSYIYDVTLQYTTKPSNNAYGIYNQARFIRLSYGSSSSDGVKIVNAPVAIYNECGLILVCGNIFNASTGNTVFASVTEGGIISGYTLPGTVATTPTQLSSGGKWLV